MNNMNITDRLKNRVEAFIQVMHDHGATRRQIQGHLYDLVDVIVDLEPGEIMEPSLDNFTQTYAGDIYQDLIDLMVALRLYFERDYFTNELSYHLMLSPIDRCLNEFYERNPIVASVNMEIEEAEEIYISDVDSE